MIPLILIMIAAALHIFYAMTTAVINDLSGGTGCGGALCYTPISVFTATMGARPDFTADYILNGLPSLAIGLWDFFSFNYAILNAGSEPWNYIGIIARLFGAGIIGGFFGSLIYAWASGRR